MKNNQYTLPSLRYGYTDLEPYISREQLNLHHTKHHQAYVNGANAAVERLDEARRNNSEIDMKSTLKDLSFHVSGHILHSLFWLNLRPEGQGSDEPMGALADAIKANFTSFERFKQEFQKTAISVEGSGWAALCYCHDAKRLFITQIEKHNANLIPNCPFLLIADAWEHAYYLDYKNDRAKFIDNIWHIINWEEVNMRYSQAIK